MFEGFSRGAVDEVLASGDVGCVVTCHHTHHQLQPLLQVSRARLYNEVGLSVRTSGQTGREELGAGQWRYLLSRRSGNQRDLSIVCYLCWWSVLGDSR